MTLTQTMFLLSAVVIFVLMVLLWLLSLAVKNASIIDVFWGIGFVILAWIDYSISPFMSPAKWLLTILVTIWGLRLALHIGLRNWVKPEDFRYAKWRKQNGPRWWWVSFFTVFLLQGLLMWIIAAPILAVRVTDGIPPPSGWDILGAAIWAFGSFFEAAGDWQLRRFRSNSENEGKLLTTGLWKYSRHPNYFGDAVQWWGFYIIAANAGAWWTIYSPLLMTFLLLRISGVTLLEKTMKSRPGYEEYMRKTSAFVPWWPE